MKEDNFESLDDTLSGILGQRQSGMTAPRPNIVATKVLQDNVHKRLEKNTHRISTVSLDGIQQLKLEVAKACCTDYNLLEHIFYDGLARDISPFCNRPLRRIKDTTIKEQIVFEVENTQYPMRWNITWQHNQRLPSFITYSVNPILIEKKLMRFADIDEEHLENYMNKKDLLRFNFYLEDVKNCNLKNRLFTKSLLEDFARIVSEAGEEISSQLGCETVLYSGAGFRPLLKADKDRFIELVSDGMLCNSSSVGYQPQKLFSAQLCKPHLQTDVITDTDAFALSNPCFFMLKKDDKFAKMCHDYYDSCLPSNFDSDADTDAERNKERFKAMIIAQRGYANDINDYVKN